MARILSRKQNKKTSARKRLQCEPLEDRRLLAILTVTNALDSGPGSLRDAIATSNTNVQDDSIVFNASLDGMTITLMSGELVVGEEGYYTLIDAEDKIVTVSGGGSSRVFNVDDGDGMGETSGTVVVLRDLVVTGGMATSGGGIRNVEDLTLQGVEVTGNTAYQTDTNYETFGGGILNTGNLTLEADPDAQFLPSEDFITDTTLLPETRRGRYPGAYVNSDPVEFQVNDQLTVILRTFQHSIVRVINRIDDMPNLGDQTQRSESVLEGLAELVVAGDTQGLVPFRLAGPVETIVLGGAGSPVGTFITQIDLQLSGKINGQPVKIRKSPQQLSTGQTTVTDLNNGLFSVDSFFDVYTELSVDNGETFIPASGEEPARVNLVSVGNTTEVADNVALAVPQVPGPGNSAFGGGIASIESGGKNVNDLVVREFTAIARNAAQGSGGGVFHRVGTAKFDIAFIEDNIAEGASHSGGGIAAYSQDPVPMDVMITNSIISGNTAESGSGIFFWSPAAAAESPHVYVYNSDIVDNVGDGAFRSSYGGYTKIVKSTISGNTGTAIVNGGGGGSPPKTVLQDSTVSGNSSPGYGGGVRNYDGYFRSLQNTIAYNTAAVGGGIYAGGQGYTHVLRTTMAKNTATVAGGNWAQYFNHGYDDNSYIRGSIITEGSAPTAPDFYDQLSTYVSDNMYYSLVSNTYGSEIDHTMPMNGNKLGYDPIPFGLGTYAADLGPLQDNGGPTYTMLPNPMSPVIDMGDPTKDGQGEMDQRMYERVVDGDGDTYARIDMGSVEYGAGPPPPVEECDLDGDGDCDIDDIDMLVMNTIDYDENGMFEPADIQKWLVDAGASPGNELLTGGCPFLEGDFNLDGFVDGQDFLIWNGEKFTSTGKYSLGDADGNGVTDGFDFIIWNGNKFMASIGSCVTAPADGHDTLAMGDHSGGSGQFRLGKDTRHTEFKRGEGLGALAALKSVSSQVVDRVIQAAPAAVTESTIAAKAEDVRLSGLALKAADRTSTLSNYTVKSMDLATARSSAHAAVDEIFADFA